MVKEAWNFGGLMSVVRTKIGTKVKNPAENNSNAIIIVIIMQFTWSSPYPKYSR